VGTLEVKGKYSRRPNRRQRKAGVAAVQAVRLRPDCRPQSEHLKAGQRFPRNRSARRSLERFPSESLPPDLNPGRRTTDFCAKKPPSQQETGVSCLIRSEPIMLQDQLFGHFRTSFHLPATAPYKLVRGGMRHSPWQTGGRDDHVRRHDPYLVCAPRWLIAILGGYTGFGRAARIRGTPGVSQRFLLSGARRIPSRSASGPCKFRRRAVPRRFR